MKITKDARKAARRFFSLCLVDGQLNETRVMTLVRRIGERKPRHYQGILSAFQNLVRIEVEKRHALIESATVLDVATREKVAVDLEKQFGKGLIFEFKENAGLIGGLRIRVGNDVWDGSVKERLERLREAL